MDLLVSYPCGHFRSARYDIVGILKRFGDDHPQIRRTAVDGIARVSTCLDSRDVTRRCRELSHTDPLAFLYAVKWVPVDYWCHTNLEAMKKLIEQEIRPRIAEHETWGMKVEKRRWQRHHTAEIVAYLAPSIDRKVNLDHPNKWLRIDVVGRQTAISLVEPEELFSSTVIE
jgi:tRNA(Ser,Leu) C12 N-acetylase TAN1